MTIPSHCSEKTKHWGCPGDRGQGCDVLFHPGNFKFTHIFDRGVNIVKGSSYSDQAFFNHPCDRALVVAAKRECGIQAAIQHKIPDVFHEVQNRFVYIFATLRLPDPVTGLLQFTGAIYYKKASLDNPSVQFPEGSGTPFILMATAQDNHINNASSTKQPLNSSTDLLVIAGNDTTKHYYHNTLDLLPLDRFVYLPLIAYNSVTADAALSAR